MLYFMYLFFREVQCMNKMRKKRICRKLFRQCAAILLMIIGFLIILSVENIAMNISSIIVVILTILGIIFIITGIISWSIFHHYC